MKNFLYIVFGLVLFACAREEKLPETQIFRIREIGELSTTEYTFGKVLKIDDKAEWYKFGDRRILISCRAKAKAGIDFRSIREEDIQLKNGELSILLPPVRLTNFSMDPNSIKTEMADINGFRTDFSQEEKNEILKLGEQSIRENLGKSGIYQEAERNAKDFVKQFFTQMGYKVVQVKIQQSNEK